MRVTRKLGGDGVVALIKLFCYAGKFRSGGILKGMGAEDIADAVGWRGEAEEFVGSLCDIGFLELCEEGIYSIHDWEEHNPWAAGAAERSEAASKAGKASAAKRAKNATDVQRGVGDSSTDVQRGVGDQFNGNPTPSPSPSPSPSPKEVRAKALLNNLPDSANRAGAVDADAEIFYLSKKKKKLKAEVLESFNRFWKAFAYSHGKAEAADAWLSVYSPGMVEPAVNAAIFEAQSRPEQIAKGKTPKWAQGWLTGRRWEDGADGQVTGRCGSCFHEKSPSCASKNAAQRIGCAYFSEVKP